ncbi:MAG: AraC family transcriptional regulator [Clostridia bacterium]|nr:AraC family transcriptional regulator [Clostridia bacterium]
MQEDYRKEILLEEYTSRINRVQDYIEANLGEELRLETLSQVANFSPYHFHRIFSTMVGEPLFQYIQRIRLEKAAFLLLANPKKSVTEISLECGFSNQASFAKAFKKYFNISASKWRTKLDNIQESKNCKVDSKIGKADSSQGKVSLDIFLYNNNVRKNIVWRNYIMTNISYSIEVKEVNEMCVAYVRHIGPYKGDSTLFSKLFDKLFKWAGARDLIHFPETQTLTLYHDSPEITEEDKLRISVCLTVPEDTEVDGEIGKMTIPGGKYAIGHFELNEDQYQDAWASMYGKWLPESGYQPDDGACFEMYLNAPEEHPEKKHIVDIYVPIKPL